MQLLCEAYLCTNKPFVICCIRHKLLCFFEIFQPLLENYTVCWRKCNRINVMVSSEAEMPPNASQFVRDDSIIYETVSHENDYFPYFFVKLLTFELWKTHYGFISRAIKFSISHSIHFAVFNVEHFRIKFWRRNRYIERFFIPQPFVK